MALISARTFVLFAVSPLVLIVPPMPIFAQTSASTPVPTTALTVHLRLVETVSSANAKVGQSVLLEVIDPVEKDGRIIVAVGARAHASVTVAKRRGHNRREGKLLLTIENVSQTDGKQATLQAATLKQGTGEGLPIFGPCTFPIPADPVGLFRKGNDVVIPKGTELVASIAPAPF